MKNTLFLSIFTAILLTSCSYNPPQEQEIVPEPERIVEKLDTIVETVVSPKIVIKKCIEVDIASNDTLVLENQKLLRFKRPYGIFTARYSETQIEKDLCSMEIPDNYCFEVTCVKSKYLPYPVIISFITRKAKGRG